MPTATDDFFQYVNGEWIKNNPIPADEGEWGSFHVLRLEVEQQLKQIFEEIAAKSDSDPALAQGSAEQKIRDFYRTAMDVGKRNRDGVVPIAPLLNMINGIATREDAVRAVGTLHRLGVHPLWAPSADQDEKQSEVVALHLWQAGLSLPDRDYYLNEDEKSKKIRAEYAVYMKDLLELAGMGGDPASDASVGGAISTIINLETRLARASSTRVELRDVEKNYHKLTLGEFAVLAPRVSLAEYFKTIFITGVEPQAAAPHADYLIIGQPKFFTEVDAILEGEPLENVKAYLTWHVLNGAAPYLSETIERRRFDFYGRTFSGLAEMKPLWRRALQATNNALDELVGKIYVARHFSEDAKKKISNLVEHLQVAYRARIEKLDWMSEETKKKAIEKLGTVSKKLGYPAKWKDYSALTIGGPGGAGGAGDGAAASSFAENAMRANAHEFDRKMREVGGPVNREEWFMPPQMVNAYYQPPLNEIAFPAAILQPPFFDPNADDATNFGGIGSVIGHELTHGFDDQGARFDAKGNLHEWWTPQDKERFDAKAAALAAQFDEYQPIPGDPSLHLNGKLTLGENIADLGGLLIAYDALKLKMAEAGQAGASTETEQEAMQKFFTNYAVTERGHAREEMLRLQAQTDPHSPSEFRVNGPASNMQEFYDAFGIKPGDKLWREAEARAKIW